MFTDPVRHLAEYRQIVDDRGQSRDRPLLRVADFTVSRMHKHFGVYEDL